MLKQNQSFRLTGRNFVHKKDFPVEKQILGSIFFWCGGFFPLLILPQGFIPVTLNVEHPSSIRLRLAHDLKLRIKQVKKQCNKIITFEYAMFIPFWKWHGKSLVGLKLQQSKTCLKSHCYQMSKDKLHFFPTISEN